jgi:hypothetical protein
MPIPAVLAAVSPLLSKVIDRAIPDKDKANEIKAEIQTQLLTLETTELKAAENIIVAEAKGGSWLQRNWRPILMLTIVAIVANNYILFPYIQLFGGQAVMLELPEKLYTLMTVGVGGYIVGRSGEKIAKELKK